MLVLGGWSPGPLDMLRGQFRADVEFWEPTIPMPPSGLRWCVNPFWVLLLVYIAAVLPVLMGAADNWTDADGMAWLIRAAVIVGSMVVVRLLIGLLVWFSIKDAMWVASGAVRSFEPDVLIGFSWGGGVACWLLAARRWSGPTILLAPTVRAMACVQCSGLPKLPRSPEISPVHVFHAEYDGFCPESQADELRAAGCEVYWCRDDHVLCGRSTVDEISRCLRQLLGREVAPAD